MTDINLTKTVFGKNTYDNVIDTKFVQLISNVPTSSLPDINSFFNSYESLFYDIPKEGEEKSHRYLVTKSAEYLDISLEQTYNQDIQVLIDEINSLQKELLEANKTIIDLRAQIKI